jgi:proton glutamate symport protein
MKIALHWQILVSLVLGGFVGWLTGESTSIGGIPLVSAYDFLGTLFLNALKMLIVPLIASSMIVGIAGIGASGSLGKLGGLTFGFYLVTTLSAILVGLALVNIVRPGEVDGAPAREILALDDISLDMAESLGNRGAGDVVNIFLRAVPENVIAAAAGGEMLAVIFFSLLLCRAITDFLDGCISDNDAHDRVGHAVCAAGSLWAGCARRR